MDFATSQLEQVELTIEAAKENIKIMNSLQRLIKNKDFKIVIDDGYLRDEAVRLVHLKADYNLQEADKQAHIVKGIDSIGYLRAYFSKIFQQGSASEGALTDQEAAREELLAEDLMGDES